MRRQVILSQRSEGDEAVARKERFPTLVAWLAISSPHGVGYSGSHAVIPDDGRLTLCGSGPESLPRKRQGHVWLHEPSNWRNSRDRCRFPLN